MIVGKRDKGAREHTNSSNKSALPIPLLGAHPQQHARSGEELSAYGAGGRLPATYGEIECAEAVACCHAKCSAAHHSSAFNKSMI